MIIHLIATCWAQDRTIDQRGRDLEALRTLDADTQILGQPKLALLDDDPFLAANEPHHEPTPKALRRFRRASNLAKHGRHAEAVAELRMAIDLDSEFYEARNNLGLELHLDGSHQLAVEELIELTKSQPKKVGAFNTLAKVFCDLGRYADAEVAARKAMRLHPFSFTAALLVGTSLVMQRQYTPEARRLLDYASIKHPQAKEILLKVAGNR